MKKVILVSTCTNNKTVSVSENKKLRNCISVIYDQAIPAWSQSLWSGEDEQVTASTLYAGSHWGETIKAFDKLSAQSFRGPLNQESSGIPKPIFGLSVNFFGICLFKICLKIHFP